MKYIKKGTIFPYKLVRLIWPIFDKLAIHYFSVLYTYIIPFNVNESDAFILPLVTRN